MINVIEIHEYVEEDWSDIAGWQKFLDNLNFVPAYVAVLQTDNRGQKAEILQWTNDRLDPDLLALWNPPAEYYRRMVFSKDGSSLALEMKLLFGDVEDKGLWG